MSYFLDFDEGISICILAICHFELFSKNRIMASYFEVFSIFENLIFKVEM